MHRLFPSRAFFLAALAVLALGGLPHARYLRLDQSIKQGTFRPTPAAIWEAVRAYLTNSGDMERYRAYAQAGLGRPYSSFYVRTKAEWDAHFTRGEEGDPSLAPEVRSEGPRMPYRDFLVEYPPAFFLVALPPALVASTLDGYVLVFKLLMACCLWLTALCAERFVRPVPRQWWTYLGGAVLALGVVTTHRYDAVVALGLCAAMWAVSAGRAVLGGVCIGVAVAIKGAPLLFIPPLLMYLFAERGFWRAVRLLFAAGAVVLISIVPVLLSSGWAFTEAFNYHRVRPLQIESMFGALLALSRVLSSSWIRVVHSFGSVNLAGPAVAIAGMISTSLMLLGILLSYAVTWWRMRTTIGPVRRQVMMEGIILTGLAFMLFGKVFSPQYLTWILPLCVSVAGLQKGRRAQALIGLLLLTQVIFPLLYKFVMELEPWAVMLVVLRNLGLAIWAASLLRTGAHEPAGALDPGPSGATADLGPLSPPGAAHPAR